MSKKKIAVLIGVVVVIAALGGTGFYFREDIMTMVPAFQAGSSEDKVYVEKVSKIMNQYTGISNRFNGTVESQDTYEVNVDSTRTVEEVNVEVGDVVEEGQVLLTYDVSDIKMQIQQANLEVESINNDIDNYNKQIATLAAERDKAAEADKFSYTTQIQTLENNIAQRKFDLESKQLEISKYENQRKNSTVTSKVAGVVKEINEKGIDANGNTAAFMTILQTGEYRIKGSIDEQNIWTLMEGQSVVIRSRVDDEQTWTGMISMIDTENPEQNNNNYYYESDSMVSATKYPFYIELESAEGLILGQHVYIELDEGQEEEKEGLWLYGTYIVQDDGEPYVWAANDRNRLEKKYVELGEYDADMDQYEIIGGITTDDYITWPMDGLYEGVTTVTNAEEVDYSSPLYNQPVEDGMGEEDFYMDDVYMEDVYGTEMMDLEGYDDVYMEEGVPEDGEDFSTDGAEAEMEDGASGEAEVVE